MNNDGKRPSNPGGNIDIEKLRQAQMETKANINAASLKAKEELELQRRRRQEAKEEIIRKINDDSAPTVIKTTKLKNEPLKKKFTHKIQLIKDTPLAKPQQNAQEYQEKLSYTLQMDAISPKQINAYKKRKNRKTGINVNDKFVDLGPRITRIYLAVTIPLLLIASALLYLKFT